VTRRERATISNLSKEAIKVKTTEEEQVLNQKAFLRLREKLAKTHLQQFIGIVSGKVVATAPTL